MPDTETPPDPVPALRALSDILVAHANAAVREMQTNTEYWGTDATNPAFADDAFYNGVRNALSDMDLVASFTPGFASTLSDLLGLLVAAKGEGGDLCSHSDKIYDTARELAERYPTLDLTGDSWPLAIRPRPAEPTKFGGKIYGWYRTPHSVCEWLNVGKGTWISEASIRCSYDQITVTGIVS